MVFTNTQLTAITKLDSPPTREGLLAACKKYGISAPMIAQLNLLKMDCESYHQLVTNIGALG